MRWLGRSVVLAKRSDSRSYTPVVAKRMVAGSCHNAGNYTTPHDPSKLRLRIPWSILLLIVFVSALTQTPTSIFVDTELDAQFTCITQGNAVSFRDPRAGSPSMPPTVIFF